MKRHTHKNMSFFDKFKKKKKDKKEKKEAPVEKTGKEEPAKVKDVKDAKKEKPVAKSGKEKPIKVAVPKKEKEKEKVKKETKVEATQEKSSAKSAELAMSEKASSNAARVLLAPVISEKSAELHSLNQYVFKVSISANKVQIKKAIEEIYKAKPVRIRIINVSGKYVTRGKVSGRTSDYKKAIVVMPKGVKLPVYEGV